MSHFAERLWRPRKRKIPGPRLAVELLEARLTPALFDAFFPIPEVAVNPQPLPPKALVQFIPELVGSPSAPAAGAPAAATPFHVQGHLRESIQGGWVLDAVYTLDGQLTQTETPGPMGTDSVAVSYDYMAHLTEIFYRLGGSNGGGSQSPVWLADVTQSSHGGASVEIVVTKPLDVALVDASFHDTTTAHETMMPLRGNPGPWSVDAVVASQGTLNGIESHHGSGAGGGSTRSRRSNSTASASTACSPRPWRRSTPPASPAPPGTRPRWSSRRPPASSRFPSRSAPLERT
jgi:hypothetical protein